MMRAVALVALVLCAALPAAADFADGAQAYDGGDYQSAFREWSALARRGDARAQVAIAWLHRFSEGRAVDVARAARWYRRAAVQGNAVAQLNLGEMFLLGIGVARDRVRALMWLSLAARRGKIWAADQRDALARRMTEEQRARARAMVRSWKPVPWTAPDR